MAGDWIKMRTDLFTHPKVVRIASSLKADTLRAVGGLMSVWCLFDAHSEDGRLDGYTTETIDDHLRWPGFAAAMMQVKWLQVLPDGSLALPEFGTHNGQSAKRRALDKDRKKEVRKESASGADNKRTREEKRREEPTVGEFSASVEDLAGAGSPAGRAPGAPVTPGSASDAEEQVAVRASIALRKLGMRVQPAMPQLLDLVARGTTVEQLCMTAAELALRKASMFGDPDLHPELLELFASGATQQQMLLTTPQYTALRNAAPNIGYLAQTLIGRAQDAARGDGHGQSIGRSQAGGHAGPGSAAGRAEAARRAGDARDADDKDIGF